MTPALARAEMTDAQFRASVRADAIKAGCPPAVADYLSAQVGKTPTGAEREHRDETRSRLAGYRMTGKSDALDRIAFLFGAEKLVPDFRRAGVPLPRVVALLSEVTGTRRAIGAAGIANVRMQLQALAYYRGTAS